MSDEADLLTGLHGLREAAPGWADLIAALGLGLIAAWGLSGLVRLFRPKPARTGIEQRIAMARNLPADRRVAALAHVLQQIAQPGAGTGATWTERAVALGFDTALLDQMQGSLYRPGPMPDPDRLEHAVLRLAEQARQRP